MTKLYHYTRLLPEELGQIQTNGLVPLSESLYSFKQEVLKRRGIEIELDRHYLTDADTTDYRVGRIFFTPQRFEDDESDVIDLLTKWGGETIYNLCEEESWFSKVPSCSTPYEISVHFGDVDFYDYVDGTRIYSPGLCFSKDVVIPEKLEFRDMTNLVKAYLANG